MLEIDCSTAPTFAYTKNAASYVTIAQNLERLLQSLYIRAHGQLPVYDRNQGDVRTAFIGNARMLETALELFDRMDNSTLRARLTAAPAWGQVADLQAPSPAQELGVRISYTNPQQLELFWMYLSNRAMKPVSVGVVL